MSKKRTQKQIDAEIKWLKDNKSKVPSNTFFGDSNHAAIDAQIEALETAMDEDEAYGKETEGEWDERERSHAVDAIEWREGESDEAPSGESSWGGVVARAQKGAKAS